VLILVFSCCVFIANGGLDACEDLPEVDP